MNTSFISTQQIKDLIKGLYDVEISEGLVSKISERILPEVKQWQDRPLKAYYPFVFMDAIHYKIREDYQVETKAAYVIPGINEDGIKEVLFRLSRGDPKDHLYDKCDRRTKPTIQKSDKDKECIP